MFVLDNGTTISAPTNIDGALNTITYDALGSFGCYREPSSEAIQTLQAIRRDVQINLREYRRLSNYECLSRYANPYELRSNVLLVSKDYDTAVTFNTSLLVWDVQLPTSLANAGLRPTKWSRDWLNLWTPLSSLNSSIMNSWKSQGYRVQYCLQVPDALAASAFNACRVQCAPSVLFGMRNPIVSGPAKEHVLVTSIFNLIKSVGIVWLLYGRSQHTICTLGDAIASFLETPDTTTSKFGVATSHSLTRIVGTSRKEAKAGPQMWLPKDIRWFNAGSKGRWWFTMTT